MNGMTLVLESTGLKFSSFKNKTFRFSSISDVNRFQRWQKRNIALFSATETVIVEIALTLRKF